MTDRLRAAAQAAIEALERARAYVYETDRPQVDDAMDRLRAALAEPHHHGDSESMCWCDRQKIGEPGVSCGDCPTRDYKKPDQMRDATEMIDDRLRIERLVRANARRAMVIDIIERLVEDPEREDFGPSDMEYWSPLHDALREKLSAALAEQSEDWDRVAALEASLREHMAEIHRLRAALAEPYADKAQQFWGTSLRMDPVTGNVGIGTVALTEPVAWMKNDGAITTDAYEASCWRDRYSVVNLYTAPPRRQWVGLTDEEMYELVDLYRWHDADCERLDVDGCVRAIESALKEKNHD